MTTTNSIGANFKNFTNSNISPVDMKKHNVTTHNTDVEKSNAAQIMLGATALAGTIALGIYLAKSGKLKGLFKKGKDIPTPQTPSKPLPIPNESLPAKPAFQNSTPSNLKGNSSSSKIPSVENEILSRNKVDDVNSNVTLSTSSQANSEIHRVPPLELDNQPRIIIKGLYGDIEGTEATILAKFKNKSKIEDLASLGTIEKYNGEQLVETISRQDNGIVYTRFNAQAQKESTLFVGDSGKNLKTFLQNDILSEEFSCYDGLTLYKNNLQIKFTGVKPEKFDEAIALVRKYENIDKKQLEKIYYEIINGNPQKISKLEFDIIEGWYNHNNLTIPQTSKTTYIPRHHDLHGVNYAYRKEQNATKDIIEIDNAIKQLPPLEKDCIFYRGVCKEYIPDIINGKVGDTVTLDKAYPYTAFHPSLAQEFGDGTIIRIKTPKGAKVSRNLEHEGEALFPRNAQCRILSKGKTPPSEGCPNGEIRIDLEYILPKDA